eukprot:jgi/Chlat1/5830/Chrsp4S06224
MACAVLPLHYQHVHHRVSSSHQAVAVRRLSQRRGLATGRTVQHTATPSLRRSKHALPSRIATCCSSSSPTSSSPSPSSSVPSTSTSSTKVTYTEDERLEYERRVRDAVARGEEVLARRIANGEFSVGKTTGSRLLAWLRAAAKWLPFGRMLAKWLADVERRADRAARARMPEARGDIREIIGQPPFVPLHRLFLAYGGIFRLSFGPKSFVVISQPGAARHVLAKNAKNYSKGLLSEILYFVMGNGLIPADGEIWLRRRKTILPALHKQYVAAMVTLFGRATLRCCDKLEAEVADIEGASAEMEGIFSRYALDVIGKAVFNYEFDALEKDTGVIGAVYTVLREAEYRSIAVFPYWLFAPLRWIVPRQRRCTEALQIINDTLNELISKCKDMVDREDLSDFSEETYINDSDPSILHFLLAAGDDYSSKQLRDDLMTLLIAGHETTAAVLTWSMYLLSLHPEEMVRAQEEADRVIGDRMPSLEDIRELKFIKRIVNESMRLYPQPPVLLRRALGDDLLAGYKVRKGDDIFISVWNLHRDPKVWKQPEDFVPLRWALNGPDPNEYSENFSYLPFGAGPRKCIGDQFASFQSIVALSMLLRRFTFSMAPGAPQVGMTTGATIHTSEGLHMRLQRRNKPSSGEHMLNGHSVDSNNFNGSSNGVVDNLLPNQQEQNHQRQQELADVGSG